jgi:hypothetical protein
VRALGPRRPAPRSLRCRRGGRGRQPQARTAGKGGWRRDVFMVVTRGCSPL